MGLVYIWTEHMQGKTPLGIALEPCVKIEWNRSGQSKECTSLEISIHENEVERFYGPNIESITALVGEDGAEKTRICRDILDIFAGQKRAQMTAGGWIWLEENSLFVVSNDQRLQTVIFENESRTFRSATWKTQGDRFQIHLVPLGTLNASAPDFSICPYYFSNSVAALTEWGKYKNEETLHFQETPVTMMETIGRWTDEAFLEETGVFGFPLERTELRTKYAGIYFKLQAIRACLGYDLPYKDRTFEIKIPLFGESPVYCSGDTLPEQKQKSLTFLFGRLEEKTGVLERAYILILENVFLIYGTDHQGWAEIGKLLADEITRLENTEEFRFDQEWLKKLVVLLESEQKTGYSKKQIWSKQIIRAIREIQAVLKEEPKAYRYKIGKYPMISAKGKKLLELYDRLVCRQSPLWRGALEIVLPEETGQQKECMQLFGCITKFVKEQIKNSKQPHTFLLLLDEIEAGLHPKQQQCLIEKLTAFLSHALPESHFQILLTTNSPIVLSDLTAGRVFKVKQNEDGTEIEKEEMLTFGANLYDLFCRGLSMDEGTTGFFAQRKINSAIQFARSGNREQMENRREFSYIVNSVGEEFIRDYIIDEIQNPYLMENLKFKK